MRRLLVLFLIVGCSLFADENAFDFYWLPNTEPDIHSYQFWVWEGPDTSGVTIENYMYHGEFPHDSLYAIRQDTLVLTDTYVSDENGQWMRIAGKAVNDSGNVSDYSYSEWYKKENNRRPANMQGLGIRK